VCNKCFHDNKISTTAMFSVDKRRSAAIRRCEGEKMFVSVKDELPAAPYHCVSSDGSAEWDIDNEKKQG